MLDFLVRSTLGSWGSALLDFYLANSFWINGIILLLILLNVLGRRTYAAILTALISQISENDFDIRKGNSVPQMQKILDAAEISWDALAQTGWYPLIAVPGKTLPVVKNSENLKKIFNAEHLVELVKADQEKL
ncbi:MAG: hypothetical protein K8R77_14765 [Anaerolineaceae bacterium]|nr:hypothetical protein [Anaerolineaceae bacterium]